MKIIQLEYENANLKKRIKEFEKKMKKKESAGKISISQLRNDFNLRHDFESEDIDVLRKKFKAVSIQNIPEAWVVIVDSMLTEISCVTKGVTQQYGFMCVLLYKTFEEDVYAGIKKTIESYEEMLYLIDEDLHNRLDLGKK